MKIKQSKAIEMMNNSGGLIFGARFFKRSDGSVRTGSFRIGVRKNIKGNPRYNPKSHNIFRVYDMKKGFRSIPFEGILSITLNGTVYTVEGGRHA